MKRLTVGLTIRLTVRLTVPALACLCLALTPDPALAQGQRGGLAGVVEASRRATRPTLVALGAGASFDATFRSQIGAAVTLSRNLGPHLAIDTVMQVGRAGGPMLTTLAGWSGLLQAGVKWIWFEGLFSPYLGARIGGEYIRYQPSEVGGWFAPSSEEEAIQEAERRSGFGLLGTGLLGMDFTFRSGVTFGIEAQAGYVHRAEPDSGWVLLLNHWVGCRF